MASSSSSPHLSSIEPLSASVRKHGIENVELWDSWSEELLSDSSLQHLIELPLAKAAFASQPPGPTIYGRMSDKQLDDSDLRDSISEELQMASREHVIHINQLLASTKEKLLMLPPLSSEYCIYSVPHYMRVSNDQHFTPKIVSIGPIHYHNEKLRANQHLKERYLAEFLEFTEVSMEEFYKVILVHERRLRDCYADVIKLNGEDFIKMVLMDAAFLLMILFYNYGYIFRSKTDRLFGKTNMIIDIKYDMLLLENQLPLFILEELYKLSKLHYYLGIFSRLEFSEEIAMTSLCDKFLNMKITRIKRRNPCRTALHILDMLRSCLIQDWNPKREKTETKDIPSVKELHQAGVNIEVGPMKNMFNIKFDDGTLVIPMLDIDDDTELIFRNLLAFESRDCTENPCFSYYFDLMRYLTLSSADSELLIKKGVIDNGLPNAEGVTKLFHNICTGNIGNWSISPYYDLINQLNGYYKNRWHKWMAVAKQEFLEVPWAICSVSAAVILLLLTITGTIFSILQVVLPK